MCDESFEQRRIASLVVVIVVLLLVVSSAEELLGLLRAGVINDGDAQISASLPRQHLRQERLETSDGEDQ